MVAGTALALQPPNACYMHTQILPRSQTDSFACAYRSCPGLCNKTLYAFILEERVKFFLCLCLVFPFDFLVLFLKSFCPFTQDLQAFLEQRRGQCGIIYARLRETCDSLASALRSDLPEVDSACCCRQTFQGTV